jgi:hypothetical protein
MDGKFARGLVSGTVRMFKLVGYVDEWEWQCRGKCLGGNVPLVCAVKVVKVVWL